jgi:hypothetical protein
MIIFKMFIQSNEDLNEYNSIIYSDTSFISITIVREKCIKTQNKKKSKRKTVSSHYQTLPLC